MTDHLRVLGYQVAYEAAALDVEVKRVSTLALSNAVDCIVLPAIAVAERARRTGGSLHPFTETLIAMAREADCVVIATTVSPGEGPTVLAVDADGPVLQHREYDFNSPSDAKMPTPPLPIVRIQDTLVGLMVGRERSLFEASRLLTLAGASLVVTSDAVPASLIGPWRAELIALAANCGVYVLGVNSSGMLGGGSLLVDPLGIVVDEAGSQSAPITGTVSAGAIAEARLRYFVLRDLRPELLDELLAVM